MKHYLNDVGLLCALGNNKAEILPRLLAGDRSGLVSSDLFSAESVIVGQINAPLPDIPARYAFYQCRNNQLLLAALSQIRPTVENILTKFGKDRVGVVLGTSTSGVRNTELALAYQAKHGDLPANFHYKQQQMGAGADFLAAYLGITGVTYTISTACSSSGKAFASARRLINLGVCDAVIVGGADSLCSLTIQGFASLASLSTGLCKPFSLHRDGINIGEAASLFVLSKEPSPIALLGIGASSDAYHFSAPNPEGTFVITAMQTALDDAGKTPTDIDYLNLHGTATLLNDAMESKAVHQLFGAKLAASSSKGMTGHTLGAAAALELGFCWLLLDRDDKQGVLIPNCNDDVIDHNLPALNLVAKGGYLGRKIKVCQSNSFAFGGNNLSLILAKI
ncbi:MAG: beta-ketoacyl-[acyl-carrier-protein] synthase family protein [Methylococcaceae bacterium]|nr:beta-ketoacyl-[acyl-carrier-protein] synthase family protein [Methylococcaceae bacterium]